MHNKPSASSAPYLPVSSRYRCPFLNSIANAIQLPTPIQPTHLYPHAEYLLTAVLIARIDGKSDILQYRQPQVHRVNFWSTTVKFAFYITLRAENGNVCWALMTHFQYGFDFRNKLTRQNKQQKWVACNYRLKKCCFIGLNEGFIFYDLCSFPFERRNRIDNYLHRCIKKKLNENIFPSALRSTDIWRSRGSRGGEYCEVTTWMICLLSMLPIWKEVPIRYRTQKGRLIIYVYSHQIRAIPYTRWM
jgi:hypothetical protein